MFVDALGVFGETSGGLALQKMHEKMLSSAEGQSVLRDKPRINTKTVNLDHLRGLAPNSFGRAYVKFLEDNVNQIFLD
jgi:ubiquinone biosynthesis protein COQ4